MISAFLIQFEVCGCMLSCSVQDKDEQIMKLQMLLAEQDKEIARLKAENKKLTEKSNCAQLHLIASFHNAHMLRRPKSLSRVHSSAPAVLIDPKSVEAADVKDAPKTQNTGSVQKTLTANPEVKKEKLQANKVRHTPGIHSETMRRGALIHVSEPLYEKDTLPPTLRRCRSHDSIFLSDVPELHRAVAHIRSTTYGHDMAGTFHSNCSSEGPSKVSIAAAAIAADKFTAAEAKAAEAKAADKSTKRKP
jgi:hypothetical protein